MSELIYRFRTRTQHSIVALLNNGIEGSKYCEMEDKKEVSLTIDVEEIKNITKLDESLIAQTASIIREHIINSYYISCFSKDDRVEAINMWETYANKDGFCLAYDVGEIKNAIEASMRRYVDRFHTFRNVDYGFLPTDITSFVKDYLLLVGDNLENEEAHRRAAKIVGDRLTKEERKRIIGSMFHKIGIFPEKSEIRIVSLLGKHESNWCSDVLGVPVKPKIIVCSSLMPQDDKRTIFEFAKNNGILVSVKEMR